MRFRLGMILALVFGFGVAGAGDRGAVAAVAVPKGEAGFPGGTGAADSGDTLAEQANAAWEAKDWERGEIVRGSRRHSAYGKAATYAGNWQLDFWLGPSRALVRLRKHLCRILKRWEQYGWTTPAEIFSFTERCRREG